MTNLFVRLLLTSIIMIAASACNEREPSISLLPQTDTFQQKSETINNKIDILWMVDTSGSMANHQTNLATNFSAFITDFVDKGYDYNMVVASTDAWVREYNYNAGSCGSNPNPSQSPNTIYKSSADCANTLATFGDLTKFRDGDIYGLANGTPGVRSGNYLISSLMLPQDIITTFAKNIKVGIRGDGSERGFQSLRAVLRRNSDGSVAYGGETHTQLANFRRSDAFFAVIIVSDEEDFSRKQNNSTYTNIQNYTDEFVGFMDGYTGGVEGNRKYNVSSIVIEDINNCPYGLNPSASQGDKYISVANATNGVVGSICSTDFSDQLNEVASKIVTLSTRFQLSREPIPETIHVVVNGAVIPNQVSNGWIYVAEGGFHYVEFHGSAVPAQGDNIAVGFDPATIK